MNETFSNAELQYLRSQRLGWLATVDRHSAPQNSPVGFVVDDAGRVLIGGHDLAATRTFRNLVKNPNVAFVVDDLVSVDPWTVRGIEVRGTAEALADVDPPRPWMGRAVIRITASWVTSWGLEPDGRRTRWLAAGSSTS